MPSRLLVGAGLFVAGVLMWSLGCGAAQAGEDAKGDLEEVKFELPLPMFRGTPKELKFDEHIEKPSGKPRPAFLAPKGTKNVALKKPVTSSDDAPIIGELAQVTDGDKKGSDGSYVELGPGRQWVQIDLQEKYNIHALLVWHFHGEARIYHDVVVQVADDPDFITNVRTIYNNDYDNSSGLGIGKDLEYLESNEGRLMPCKDIVARYVRLYSKGSTANDMNHYTEVEVYATPAK
ncbi:MAG TPA: hypothetical protein PLE19_11840 [Planctomycetota bacterium]|nr:hypothetical protein [Planctomycetota bacterium]HRR81091.1 hypothetical protein [Planctomycetota bacterium]HRT94353.1 hypothetical protein [Planctomycetota bacterium]